MGLILAFDIWLKRMQIWKVNLFFKAKSLWNRTPYDKDFHQIKKGAFAQFPLSIILKDVFFAFLKEMSFSPPVCLLYFTHPDSRYLSKKIWNFQSKS